MPTPVANPANIAAVQDILREVWVSDTLRSQLYDDMVLFDYIDEVTEYTDSDGLKASVPLKTGRTGGVGSRAIGDLLPLADRQKVAKASYNYTNHYAVVMVYGPVVAKMETNRQAAVREVDFEVTNAIEDLKHMITRQLHQDGTGAITLSGLPGNASSTTIPLGTANFPVVDKGWLYEGLALEIGTAANPSLDTGAGNGVRIVSIDDTPTAPTITVDTAVAVTAGSHISTYGNRKAGSVSNEMNGLSNIVSDSLSLGGITPGTASYWKAARIHNSGVARSLSVDLMLSALRKIRQKGSYPEVGLTDLYQEQAYYNLLSPQVRFQGEGGLSAGSTEGLAFAKLKILGDPEALPGKIRFLRKKSLQMYSAGEIAWQNQTTGGDVLAWKQDQDAFVGRAAKYCQLGTDRRRDFAVLEDLSSPVGW